ncbi:MAG: Fur family transcriptional regulator [Bacillota bacterium]|jgi:Fur family transcriptional regulator, peroxide stress response regulator
MKNPSNEDLLRARGLRVTPQRLAVLSFIRSSKEHPTAEEIYEAVRLKHPAISLNTVYRSLDAFEEADLVQKFTIGDRSNYRYDFTTQSHLHHYCTRCGRVSDWGPDHIDALANLIRKIAGDDDGTVERVEVHLLGLCSDCLGNDSRQK